MAKSGFAGSGGMTPSCPGRVAAGPGQAHHCSGASGAWGRQKGGDVLQKFRTIGFSAQMIVTVLVMAIVVFVGYEYFPAIGARTDEIRQKQAQLDELTAEVQKGVDIEKKLPVLEREVVNVQAQLDELKTIIPPDRSDGGLVSKLESLATRSARSSRR